MGALLRTRSIGLAVLLVDEAGGGWALGAATADERPSADEIRSRASRLSTSLPGFALGRGQASRPLNLIPDGLGCPQRETSREGDFILAIHTADASGTNAVRRVLLVLQHGEHLLAALCLGTGDRLTDIVTATTAPTAP